MRAAGIMHETSISYAGLNLALRPLAGSAALLDRQYRDALAASDEAVGRSPAAHLSVRWCARARTSRTAAR